MAVLKGWNENLFVEVNMSCTSYKNLKWKQRLQTKIYITGNLGGDMLTAFLFF